MPDKPQSPALGGGLLPGASHMPHKPHKPPKPVWTIILSFGPSMPPFQQHFPRERDAKIAALHLKDRMNGARGRCIEGVQLWSQDTLIASYYPISIVLPPPDENGVRHIPERGPRRLPSTTIECLNPKARKSGWGVAFCKCAECERMRSQSLALKPADPSKLYI